MPHMTGTPYAVVSCHVERPLDDDCWRRFSDVQARRPGGFSIAALLRPPDPKAGEDTKLWLERAREAARRGPLGHHTHFVGPAHARPAAGDGAEHAERVRHEALCMDERVAEVLAELGCADCTGTAFVPSYLTDGARRLSAESPAWLTLPSGQRLLELPSTHSLGMAARASTASLPAYVHVYFHDTDLLSARRRAALRWALALLGRRCDVTDLDRLREAPNVLPQQTFALH